MLYYWAVGTPGILFFDRCKIYNTPVTHRRHTAYMRSKIKSLPGVVSPTALILEDDSSLAAVYRKVLESEGYSVTICDRVAAARIAIRSNAPDLLLIDIDLPDGNGLDLMDELRSDTRNRFIVISGDNTQRAAIKSIRHRAVELLIKPVTLQQLRNAVSPQDALSGKGVTDTSKSCWIHFGSHHTLTTLRTALSYCAEHSGGHALVTGQEGVEKLVVAQEVHRRSRRPGRCVIVDCAYLTGPGGISRMFGEENADTGEIVHEGYVDHASGGTLILDHVEQLSTEIQSRLISLLDWGDFKRVGGARGANSTVAVIGIARQSGTTDVDESSLRPDLLFRLARSVLAVPGLQQCHSDIRSIAQFLLRSAFGQQNSVSCFTDSALEAISRERWPGNVRELRAAIEQVVAQSDGGRTIDLAPVPHEHHDARSTSDIEPWIGSTVSDMQRHLLRSTLAHNGGDKSLTASALGVSLKTLYNRMDAR